MTAVRLLHTADWQIGKGFGHIPGDEGAVIREQRLKTVRELARVADSEGVDAVLVAGDVFDQQTVSDRTIRQLCEALRGFPGPWILLPGNHDAALASSVWTRMNALGCRPEHVHLALTPEPILLLEERLAVLPAPLARRQEADDLTAWFDHAATPGTAVRVGLAHGSMRNRLPAEAEQHNPIADDRAERAALDYLALGDWHGTVNIAPRAWYAGTPETDGFRDNDSGNVLLVTLEAPGGAIEVSALPTTQFRWHRVDVELASRQSIDDLDRRFRALGEPPERQIVRLRVGGVVSLAERDHLEEVLARWEARLRYLDVDRSALRPSASESDLAALRGEGFVGAAVERLLALHEDPSAADQAYAMDALQLLYTEYHRAGEGDSAA